MIDETKGAENFSLGRVATRSFGLIGGDFRLYAGLSALIVGLPMVLACWWQLDAAAAARANGERWFSVATYLPIFVTALVQCVTNAMLVAALTRATVTRLADQPAGFVHCLMLGVSLVLPLALVAVLITLGSGLVGFVAGFLLAAIVSFARLGIAGLVVLWFVAAIPALLLWLIWSLAIPAYAEERVGLLESLGRSSTLTRGARRKMFALVAALTIALLLLWFGSARLATAVGRSGLPMLPALVSAATAALSGMVAATLQACTYIELRAVKEGVAPTDLETIFA
ncbi:MAG: hypothetical protein V4574_05745 [Pseudomonadota bacterium]